MGNKGASEKNVHTNTEESCNGGGFAGVVKRTFCCSDQTECLGLDGVPATPDSL